MQVRASTIVTSTLTAAAMAVTAWGVLELRSLRAELSSAKGSITDLDGKLTAKTATIDEQAKVLAELRAEISKLAEKTVATEATASVLFEKVLENALKIAFLEGKVQLLSKEIESRINRNPAFTEPHMGAKACVVGQINRDNPILLAAVVREHLEFNIPGTTGEKKAIEAGDVLFVRRSGSILIVDKAMIDAVLFPQEGAIRPRMNPYLATAVNLSQKCAGTPVRHDSSEEPRFQALVH